MSYFCFSVDPRHELPASSLDIRLVNPFKCSCLSAKFLDRCSNKLLQIHINDSPLFSELEKEEETDQILGGSSWKPLKSPADQGWVKTRQTEEEEWLTSLKVPKEWLPGTLLEVPTFPNVGRLKKSKGHPCKAEKTRSSSSSWYLLSNHRQGLARGVAMTLNR